MRANKLLQVFLVLVALVIAIPALGKNNSKSANIDKLFNRLTTVIEKSYGVGKTCISKSECDEFAAAVMQGMKQANKITDPKITKWYVGLVKSSCETGYSDKLNNTNQLPALFKAFEKEKIKYLEIKVESSISELANTVASESYAVGKSLTSVIGCADNTDRLIAELENVEGVTTPLIKEFSDLSIAACLQGFYDKLSAKSNWPKIEKLVKKKKVIISEIISKQ